MEVLDFLKENIECYDRFTFDKVFRYLLSQDYNNEESKDMILWHCRLSALTFQERIYNGFYKNIRVGDKISTDLVELFNEERKKVIFNQMMKNINLN